MQDAKRDQYFLQLGDFHVSQLLYADDIILFSENQSPLQSTLSKMNESWMKFKLDINMG